MARRPTVPAAAATSLLPAAAAAVPHRMERTADPLSDDGSQLSFQQRPPLSPTPFGQAAASSTASLARQPASDEQNKEVAALQQLAGSATSRL